MKKIIILITILGSVNTVFAQTKSCCSASATQQFAMLSKDKAFVNLHDEPLPLLLKDETGKMIKLKTSGVDANAYLIKSSKPSKNYLLVIHEWWGLNAHIKLESENLAKALVDVNVIALDLYDGNVALVRDSAEKYMNACTDERARQIINGVITYCGKDANIATIGWCFGGGWSLQTAILANTHAKGCVMYYGMPEENIDKLKSLNCDVLGIFGSKDGWITPVVVEKFQNNMKFAGKGLTVKSYDAFHAFANPSNPNFDKAATEDAHTIAVAFIKKCFGL